MTYTDTLYAFAIYMLAVSSAGFIAMVWDKECAKINSWRISEQALLAFALVGGSVGVIAAQKLVRHKTRKEPFRTYLRMIIIVQFTVLMAFSFPTTRNYLMDILP